MEIKDGIVVSVIIPSYNHAKYIVDTLISVFDQDVSSNIYEVIVVDDGSTDDSVEILKALQATQSFNLITQSNKGVSAALNNGIASARGEYIALLASDDLWASNKLRLQIDALKNFSSSRFCFTNGSVFGGVNRKKYKPFVFSGCVEHIIPIINFVPSSSMFFHKSLFDEVGGFSHNVALEDWDFLIRASHVTCFTCVNKPLVQYRVHDSSTMKRLRTDNSILKKKLEVLFRNRSLIKRPIFWLSILLHRSYEELKQAVDNYTNYKN